MARLSKEQWDELLSKFKEGKKVAKLAEKYGVCQKTIYNKSAKLADKDVSALELNKLKREVKQLREVLGYVTAELSKEKKLV